MDEALNIGYIRGFFDRLCSVDEEGRAIVLTTAATDLGRRVAARLRQERIQCSIRDLDGGTRVKLRISTREALERWRQAVGFEDATKKERLDRVLASYGGENE